MDTRPTSIILAVALGGGAASCTEAQLRVDGKYTCEEPSGCPTGFLCVEGRCHDGFPHQSDSCDLCVTQECSSALDACGDDDGCRQLYACVAGCSEDEPGCRMECESMAPETVAQDLFEQLDACRRASCLEPCIGVRGLFASAGEACDDCVVANCGGELLACVGPQDASEGYRAADCERFRWCDSGETKTPASYLDCSDALAIPPTNDELYSCYVDRCAAECRRGETWDCVGEYDWPPPTDSTTHTFILNDTLSGVPVEGLTLGLNRTCLPDSVISTGVTDQDGEVEIDVPLSGRGFDGCLELSAPGYFDTVHWRSRPYLGYRTIWNWVVYPIEIVTLLTPVLSIEQIPGTGHAIVRAWDCVGAPAHGIHITGRSGSDPVPTYYAVEGFPDPDASSAESGTAYFFNIPPGLFSVEISTEDGVVVSGTTIHIRADHLHELRLDPYTAAGAP